MRQTIPSGAILTLLLTGLFAPSIGSGASQMEEVAGLQAGPAIFEADVPVRGAYLFADDVIVEWDDDGDGEREQHRLEAPLIVDLAAAGFKPGDLICIGSQGVVHVAAHVDWSLVWSGQPGLVGVFSSSDMLLWDRSQPGEVGPLNRVPGAIDAGSPYTPYRTGPTQNGYPTNIAEDFSIDGSDTTVRIPQGAAYLMVAFRDNQLCDNDGWIKVTIDKDSDGDGLRDYWETNGIDADQDGTIDLVLEGADPLHKDIYVEVDFMEGHMPDRGALNDVENAFYRSPVENPDDDLGVNLHIEVDYEDSIPHQDVLYDWGDFFSIKTSHFGTPAQRSDANKAKILQAKKMVYHYCLFVHQLAEWDEYLEPPRWVVTTCSGSGEYLGNDFFVSLGTWTGGVGSRDEQAATFMHELGHNLGLDHGGGEDINYKPNYLSIMNYLFQMPNNNPFRPLDYSRIKLPDLDEDKLNETEGIIGRGGGFIPGWLYTIYAKPNIGSPPTPMLVLANLPIDWNGSGLIDNVIVHANPNDFYQWTHGTHSSWGQTLHGYNDWANLVYNFRETSGYSDGAEPGLEDIEMTWETVQAMREEAKQRHELGAIDLSVIPDVVDQTGVTVNLTLVNMGGNTENFNVTVYANSTIVASKMLALPGANITTISFPCTTAGLWIGNYTLTAYVNPVANETYTADNTVIGPIIEVVDRTPPTVTVSSPASGSVVKSSTIAAAWTGSDANSGVAGYEVRLDGGAWMIVGADTGHQFTGLGDGSHTVDVRATDMGGNRETVSVTFTVDLVPPSTAIKPGSGQDWYNASTRIEFTAVDPQPGTGVKYTFCRVDDGPLSNATDWPFGFDASEGSHVYTFWSEDKAGNVEVAQTAIIKVDTRPPTTVISPFPSNDSYPPPLTIQLSAQDAEPGSGVSKTFYSIDSQDTMEYQPEGLVALEGEHLYTYWSLDSAGNSELRKQALIRVRIPEASPLIFAGMIVLHQLLSLRRQSRRVLPLSWASQCQLCATWL